MSADVKGSRVGSEDERPLGFSSCFISYSHKDEEFARKLYSRLREENIRVWFAPEDIKDGESVIEQISGALQIYDNIILIISENSIQSSWVKEEIRNARKAEVKEQRRKLFPIRVVDFETVKEWKCFDEETGKDLAIEVREYFIPDFSNWKIPSAFEATFGKLLQDVKASID